MIVLLLAVVLVATLYVCQAIDSGKVEETAFLWLTLINFIILFIIL